MEFWYFWENKTGSLRSYGSVGTTVWLHPLDLNKKHAEKAKWELHKNATCSFKQILEAATDKATALQLLTYNLTNHPSQMNMWGTAGEV